MANTWEPLTPMPPLLLDMRWVYENPRQLGEEECLKNARAMLKQSPTRFLEQMAALEKAWQATEKAAREQLTAQLQAEAAKARPISLAEPGVDEGSERALALCETFLAELNEQQRKEDAELAARPNAAEFAGTLQKRLAEALRREKVLLDRVKELEGDGRAKAGVESEERLRIRAVATNNNAFSDR